MGRYTGACTTIKDLNSELDVIDVIFQSKAVGT